MLESSCQTPESTWLIRQSSGENKVLNGLRAVLPASSNTARRTL
jgi:hypothetical protein